MIARKKLPTKLLLFWLGLQAVKTNACPQTESVPAQLT